MKTKRAVELLIEELEYLGRSAKTLAYYRWALEKLQARFEELPTERSALMRFISAQQMGPVSKVSLWRALRRLYAFLDEECEDEKPFDKNPMKRVKRPNNVRPLPRVLHDREVDALLEQRLPRRDLAMLNLLYDCGVRAGELASMIWPKVYGDTIEVKGKSGWRVVRISPEIRQLLIGLGDGYHVWIGRKGPLTYWGVLQAVRRALYRAGVVAPKAGPHVLRHTMATHYVRSGGKLKALQEILGHTDLKTTMVYVHLAQSDVAEDHALHSPVRVRNLRLVKQTESGKEMSNA